MTCSILILTKNEEDNIVKCLRSVAFSDDAVVFDSFSTDRTVERAKAEGARVEQHVFQSYGAQREAARTKVQYRHPWVLAIDADEQVDVELAREIPKAIAGAGNDVAAFRLRRKDFFRGKWIRHATLYPSWHLRLFRPDRIHYPARGVHEYPEVDGSIGVLEGHLLHDNFSKGLAQWWHRHIRYAELEAAEIRAGISLRNVRWASLLSRNPVERRRELKSLSYHLPFRPELRYLYMMVGRGALLDGPVGWEYCRMISDYQRITDQILKSTHDSQ